MRPLKCTNVRFKVDFLIIYLQYKARNLRGTRGAAQSDLAADKLAAFMLAVCAEDATEVGLFQGLSNARSRRRGGRCEFKLPLELTR